MGIPIAIAAWGDFWGPILAPTIFALVVVFGTAILIAGAAAILEKLFGRKDQ